jgi:nucleoid-associated protein YgaU
VAAVLVTAAVAAAWAGPLARVLGAGDEVRPVARTSYVVRSGDTLWSIARSLAPEDDPRSIVDSIAAANEVDAGSLVPGQVLLIPAAG